jgi:hypothetical protein
MNETILLYVAQAVGGAVGGNILGMLTRGGGGIVGRSLIGAVGGVALAFAAVNVGAIGNVTAMWGEAKLGNLGLGEYAKYLPQLITGAVGGGVLGLVGGLLIRPRD